MALIEIECLQVVLDPVVLLTCAMVRCRGGKSACHVFSDNAAFFTQSTVQFDQLLVVTVNINSFTRF